MLDGLFLRHPREVGESYAAHARVASRVGLAMIGGGLACLVHAAVPAWAQRTGSRTIMRLAGEIGGRVPAPGAAPGAHFLDHGGGI